MTKTIILSICLAAAALSLGARAESWDNHRLQGFQRHSTITGSPQYHSVDHL